MELKGKRIVIIGGSAGIGLAIAQLAAKEGASVVIAGRNEERLKSAKSQIGKDVETKVVDIANEENIALFFNQCGPFHHLVTLGGKTVAGPLLSMESKVARDSFDNKFWGQVNAVKYALPHLEPGGSIVLFSGVYSQRPALHTTFLASINGAIESFVKALALEIAPFRINAVAPGFVDTERLKDVSGRDFARFQKELTEKIPLGRIATPEEVAMGVLYLLQNSFTTGQTLYIDGGYLQK